MISRRRALQSIAGAAVLPATTIAFAQPRPRKPPRLKEGDVVGLVEPSWSSGDRFDIALAAETVRAMGLVPKLGKHVGERHGYLAGRDEQRAADLNAMFADPAVRAIFAIRGGSGAARILPLLDWHTIRANPKLMIGFSDVTALHMAIAARAGTPTLHAPMLSYSSHWGKLSWDAFRAVAFEGATPTYSNPAGKEDRLVPRSGRIRTFAPGKASGKLLGGNLTVLTALMGTPYFPDFDGAILFLEEVEEAPYRIDRMLTQLALGGVLGKVAGVVFGQCTRCEGGSMLGGFTVSEVLDHHLTRLRIPAFEGALVGHIPDQFSLPVGIRAEMDATAGTIRMLEPAVS